MAPERLRNPADVDARADIYAVGAVAFFLLAGRKMFEASDDLALTSKVLNEEPPRVSTAASQPIRSSSTCWCRRAWKKSARTGRSALRTFSRRSTSFCRPSLDAGAGAALLGANADRPAQGRGASALPRIDALRLARPVPLAFAIAVQRAVFARLPRIPARAGCTTCTARA
jgi:serine/threonine protein kinase